jgi:hypothetical protein
VPNVAADLCRPSHGDRSTASGPSAGRAAAPMDRGRRSRHRSGVAPPTTQKGRRVVHVPPAAPRDAAARGGRSTCSPSSSARSGSCGPSRSCSGAATAPGRPPTAFPPASSSRWWTSRSSCSGRCCGGSASRRRTRPSWSSTAPQPRPRGRLQRIRRAAHLDLDASGEQAQRGLDRRRDGLGRGRRAARQRHHLDRGHPGRAAQAVRRPPAWAA